MSRPLVSCLCVTEKRVKYLERVVDCFLNQSYENKELVIIYRDEDFETLRYVSKLSDVRIKIYPVPSTTVISLGALRNLSIDKCTGDYFIQWDDDDWYHNDRIKQQIESALTCNKDASVLKQVIFFDKLNSTAYFSFERPWENTILCSKAVYEKGIRYPELNSKEDTAFMRELLLNNKLSAVSSYPTYIYIFHGTNTWNQEHFNYFYSVSQKLSPAASALINGILHDSISSTEASERLRRPELLEELDFFYMWRKFFSDEPKSN
jgi:glycosyltransferase involved in cell wall biosynthesis